MNLADKITNELDELAPGAEVEVSEDGKTITIKLPQPTYYIHKHEVSQQYGGAEEGGWWYELGVPVEDWAVISFKEEEIAYDACRALNEQERERAKKEEDYEYTSVLSYRSHHYAYSVEEFPIPVSYPKSRPHYE